MRTVLISGGAGFIGSHLVDHFIKNGDRVVIVDNLYTGNMWNIQKYVGSDSFSFLRKDISACTVNDFTRFKFDIVLHFASPASPIHYMKQPFMTMNANSKGTEFMLEIASRDHAKFLLASTSETYGDPEINPQAESYWGNVNCFGLRSCYDESKRFAETLAYLYAKQKRTDIRIARIFNSLTGDQKIIYYKNKVLCTGTFDECYYDIKNNLPLIKVPCFDKQGVFRLKPISAIHRHKVNKKGYILKTTWGKEIKLTEDHGIFVPDKNRMPVEAFVSSLSIGDEIAIPNTLPFIDTPLEKIDLISLYNKDLCIVFKNERMTNNHYKIIKEYESLIYKQTHTPSFIKQLEKNGVPYDLVQLLGFDLHDAKKVRLKGTQKYLKPYITDMESFLWVIGFFVAEGGLFVYDCDSMIQFFSDEKSLKKLIITLKQLFFMEAEDIKIRTTSTTKEIRIHSKLLVDLFQKMGFVNTKTKEMDIPNWILQLPKHQLVYFLQGYREGDGNHTEKTMHKTLIFTSSSKKLINKLNLLISKFGIIASTITVKSPYKKGGKIYESYRMTIQGLSSYNILKWDVNSVKQTLQTKSTKQIQWGRVKEKTEFKINDYVYDFSVPGNENFIGGDLICCHNTYGIRMSMHDGRAVPQFIYQALNNTPITIFGDGSQTRSLCYVDDLVDGIIKLLESDVRVPVNLGNPNEISIRNLAEIIKIICNSTSNYEFMPLLEDDPKQRCPDISRAKTLLNWEPKVDLEEGLLKTIEYFKKEMGI